MKNIMRRLVAIVVVSLALMIPKNKALADSENKAFSDSESFKQLSAEWWQWALSIPTSDNPLADPTGEKGVVGQRGDVWFLGSVFSITGGPGGSDTRTCSVPEGKAFFFPVINDVEINSPNVCGSGPANVSVRDLRATSASHINGAVNLSVTLDGKPIKDLRRVKSEVFEVALPEDNLFDGPCGGPGKVPAGIYSPAVDEGFYVLLDPLDVGPHTLHIHAENPSQGFTVDVTYNLKVVPVLIK